MIDPITAAERIRDRACLAGAAAADVFVKSSRSREVRLPARDMSHTSEQGLALRFFLPDGRAALSASTLAGPGPAADLPATPLVRRALAATVRSDPGEVPLLPGGEEMNGRGLGLLDPEMEGPVESLLEVADQIHEFARDLAAEPRIRLHTVVSQVSLVNSSGFRGSFRQTLARLEVTLTASRAGRTAATRMIRASRSLRGLAADTALTEAAALLEEGIAPRLPPAGIYPVLLSPRAAAEIVAALGAWIFGGRTPEPGARILPEAITLTDDGRLPGGVASSPFDGEGTRTRRTLLVERGILRELPGDLAAGASGSTGNGIRASFRDAPRLGPTNLFINPGHVPPADLLGTISEGILVSTLGRLPDPRDLRTPFAVPFTGRWIRKGRPGAPLGGGYLAGTLEEVLQEIETAGSDLLFTHRRGSFGSPSLLLRRAPVRSA